ncbi:hypothetical protein Tco_0262507 [Tanacetum coccineum]
MALHQIRVFSYAPSLNSINSLDPYYIALVPNMLYVRSLPVDDKLYRKRISDKRTKNEAKVKVESQSQSQHREVKVKKPKPKA